MRLNKDVDKVDHISIFARGYLEEFKACPINTSPNSPLQTHARWERPTTCCYKVNYDGAVFLESSEACIGVVVLNANGTPVSTLSQKIRFPLSVEATEAMQHGVQFVLL